MRKLILFLGFFQAADFIYEGKAQPTKELIDVLSSSLLKLPIDKK